MTEIQDPWDAAQPSINDKQHGLLYELASVFSKIDQEGLNDHGFHKWLIQYAADLTPKLAYEEIVAEWQAAADGERNPYLASENDQHGDPGLFLATLTTKHFRFVAAGATEDEARTTLHRAWGRHVTEHFAWLTVEDIDEDINIVRLAAGTALRDGEPIALAG